MSKIELYIGYWLIMLSYYPYRKLFPNEIATLKESFKIISHPELYDSATVSANYTIFVTTNNVLHEWQKSTNVFVRTDTEYTVLPQRLRTGGKSGTAANHWEK